MVIVESFSHPYRLQQQVNCTSDDRKEFVWFEFGLKSLPPFLFFILGTVRYFAIRDYGMGHCKYSAFFKSKVGISITMGFFDVLQAILILALPATVQYSGWVNICSRDYFSVFYLFQAAAWFYGTWLMIYEYKRLLSEAWYANQMYWVLNLIIECLAFGAQIDNYLQAPY